MRRNPNTRPTLIYWLFDTRPETISPEWPNGKPFYCGKTVDSLIGRLRDHFKDAKRWPGRRTAMMVTDCGREQLDIRLIETVPSSRDWVEREKFWIRTIRSLNPNATNIATGGQGPVGYIPTDAQRERSRTTMLGNKNAKGTVPTPAARAAVADSNRTRIVSIETRDKMRASHRGSPSLEERERIAASLRGKKHTDERRANMRNAALARHARKKALTNNENVV